MYHICCCCFSYLHISKKKIGNSEFWWPTKKPTPLLGFSYSVVRRFGIQRFLQASKEKIRDGESTCSMLELHVLYAAVTYWEKYLCCSRHTRSSYAYTDIGRSSHINLACVIKRNRLLLLFIMSRAHQGHKC